MDNLYNDEHDEDDLPNVSTPKPVIRRKIPHDDDDDEQENTEYDQSSKFVEHWHNLYETSINSLQSDDEDQRSTTQKPFYFERQASFERPPQVRPHSPMDESEFDPNTSKSKWEIRLPQLLNGTVGPDRQKRDLTRRHTTSIVFQRSNSQNQEFNSYFPPKMSNGNDGDKPISPLVKQLKQKFDRIIANNIKTESTRTSPQSSSSGTRLHHVTSLTCRGLTAERSTPRSRPMLPIRPSAEITRNKSRSASTESLNSSMSIANGRLHRNKTGPPVSYPKHFYPPPSTTSVVKQLLGAGATLVYDSVTEQTPSNSNRSIFKHQINIEKTREELRSKNSVLTGRQLSSDPSYNKDTTLTKSYKSEKDLSTENLSEENIYEPVVSRRTSVDSFERKSIHDQPPIPTKSFHDQPPIPTKSFHDQPPIEPNEHESSNYYAVYGMDMDSGEN